MQGTNRILPLQLTIENGIIPSVEEIEQEAGRKIVIESQREVQENESHSLHYLSWIFGILLACVVVGSIALAPICNILKHFILEHLS